MSKRKDETEQEYYLRRKEYFRKYYREHSAARIAYQTQYNNRPEVKQARKEYFRVRYLEKKAQGATA